MEEMDDRNKTDFKIDRQTEILYISYLCYKDPTFNVFSNVIFNLFFLPAILGNILVIFTLLKFKCFGGKVMFKYMLNMAISDLMIGLVLLLYPLERYFPEISNYKYFCVTRSAAIIWSIAVSGSFLVAISSDRFSAVVTPLKHLVVSQNKRMVLLVITVIWTSTFCFSFSILLTNKLDIYEASYHLLPCLNDAILSDSMQYAIAIVILVGAVYDVVCYVIVIKVLMKSIALGQSVGNAIAKTKLMIIVNLTFIMCWLPMTVADLVFLINKDTAGYLTICMKEYLILLGVIQPCTNWIYYGIWNVRLRKGFKTILCCQQNRII